MSDEPKVPPPPPPDDWTKTTPNVQVPDADDWAKTQANIPNAQADEWGKTVTNIKPIDTDAADMGKTFYPGNKTPSTPEWGLTEPNIRIDDADVGMQPGDFGPTPGYDKTTPYFQLPEAERAKYQDLPPTPAEAAARQQTEEKPGIPGWFWVSAGLMTMFFFAIIVFGIVYVMLLRPTGFEIKVINAPAGSTVTLDGSPLGVTTEDGNFELKNIRAGTHSIAVIHPTYNCPSLAVTGKDGDKLREQDAGCTAKVAAASDDCKNFQRGDDDRAELCYNRALDALPDPFTVEDLVRALNILIINFDSGKSEVPQVRLAALQKGANFIKRLPQGVVLEVGGHTDNVGNAASNQTLSDARAASVKSVLVKFGVADATLQTRGYGPSKPVDTNDTDNGRYHNRRIEYSIVRK